MGEAKTIAIIGGGASGLAAAVAAGEALRDSEGDAGAVRVVVYEASDRVGRSILATGNGRCNFSNARPDEGDYRNAAFVRRALFEFECQASRYVPSQAKTSTAYPNGVLGFFSDHGLMWREEGEGRLYPLANKAASVLDCLRAACAAAGVEERVECEVVAVEPPRAEGAPFTLAFGRRALRAGRCGYRGRGRHRRARASAQGPFLPRAGAYAGAVGHRSALAAPPRQHPRARGAPSCGAPARR